MTREDCKNMRDEINATLRELGDKWGVYLEVGNMTYDELGFNAKLTAKEKSVNGKSYEQAEFEKYCRQFGFAPAHYRMCVNYEGVDYAFVGFFPKGRKYTCKLRTRDGKEMKATADFINQFYVHTNA